MSTFLENARIFGNSGGAIARNAIMQKFITMTGNQCAAKFEMKGLTNNGNTIYITHATAHK